MSDKGGPFLVIKLLLSETLKASGKRSNERYELFPVITQLPVNPPLWHLNEKNYTHIST